MRLGFDVDGIVADMYQLMVDTVNEKYGLSLSIDDMTEEAIEKNKFVDDKIFNKEIIDTMFNEVIRDEKAITKIKPYDDSINFLKILKKQGHKLYFITARYVRQRDVTFDWFMTHDIPFDGLYVIGSAEKGIFGKDLHLDFFIDDYLHNLDSMYKFKKFWSHGIAIFDRPWNKKIKVENYKNINPFIRLKDWPDILKHLGVFIENKI
jgi:uncharacterized HAD superfamily protein